jgi:DMSO/TMAO reductase YedYZ molybdopterin-dependent catalytic subunit
MITRRNLLISAALSGVVPAIANGDELLAEALDTLPGKRPLIRRSIRPPNFETPLELLRTPFTANDAFYVRYHLAVIPQIDTREWRLRVGGASCQSAQEFTLDDLRSNRFERASIAAVNQCSGNRRGLFVPPVPGVQWGMGAIGHAVWTGVRLRDVLNAAGVAANALEVTFDGADRPVVPATPDFVKSLPIERALAAETLIAFEMNGAPLPHWNGAPARLVVPGWTGTYWTKHLTDIRIEPQAMDAFWMKSAYRLPSAAFPGIHFASQEAAETRPITEVLVNSFITSHRGGERIRRSESAQLRGWSWDGGSGIAAVEISEDAGQTWREAALGLDMGRFAWREFRFPIDTARAGRHSFMVRARSRAGVRQPEGLTPNPSGYHHNQIQTLELEVV